MTVKTSHQLTARLARVERDIRMLKWLWLFVALGLGLTQRFPMADRYSAQSYVLHNSDGQQVGRFAIDADGMLIFQIARPKTKRGGPIADQP